MSARHSEMTRMTDSRDSPKVCPICRHSFQGTGWDGFVAHWRAKHEDIMRYREAWPLIQAINTDVSEFDDAEGSYRRGYQQGAYDALQAIQTVSIPKVRAWVEEKLMRWRYLERVHDRYFRPPPP
jgi:hypothetical protein